MFIIARFQISAEKHLYILNQVTENCSVRIEASSDVRKTQEKPETDS